MPWSAAATAAPSSLGDAVTVRLVEADADDRAAWPSS